MKVRIDGSRCEGHARCFALLPEVFEIDEEGYGHVKKGCEEVAEEIREKVTMAVKNCPEYAITLTEE